MAVSRGGWGVAPGTPMVLQSPSNAFSDLDSQGGGNTQLGLLCLRMFPLAC